MFKQISRLDTVSRQAQFAIEMVVIPANFVILSRHVSSGPSLKISSLPSSDWNSQEHAN